MHTEDVRERHEWEDHAEFLETLPESGMFTTSPRLTHEGNPQRWSALGRAVNRGRSGQDSTWVLAAVIVLAGALLIVAAFLGAGR
jgi:hypothetical protein